MTGGHDGASVSAHRGPPVLGVVLAAGAGSRYGEPKIGAHQGQWLNRAVHALAIGGCGEVLVAMGARIVEPPAGSSALEVPRWADGLGETVRVAIAEGRRRPGLRAMVLHVVDTPDVGPEVVARVIAAAGPSTAALARAVYEGRPGHPVCVGADHLGALAATLTGDVGAGPYLAARHVEVVTVECGDLATGVDIDRP
jgi:CTP:molybdopterin cytidylyltransferase MocA